VIVDDYIPKPATGGLGKAIIDKIADLSRDMNAVVLPVYEENLAFIALDASQIVSETVTDTVTAVFPDLSTDTAYSNPVEIEKEGSIANIISISGIPIGQVEVQYGREILWFGDFEDEGSTIWDMGTNSNILFDQAIRHSGYRSIKIYSNCYQSSSSSTEMEDKLVIDDNKDYTLCGYIKGINANHPKLQLRYYSSRYGVSPINVQSLESASSGTFDWQLVSADLNIPNNGYYGTVGVSSSPPVLDEGWAWFDDAALIEWESSWHAIGEEIPHPNNYRWLRFRVVEANEEQAEVVYSLVKYSGKELWFQ